ncbi:MAG: TIM barrel protein [Pseudomonadota bacterium]
MKFSANLGFLWTNCPLPEAIFAAKAAGFDAVECHWPYDVPADEVARALNDTGLPMLGLNTIRGEPGENGLSAIPGRSGQARSAIDQALEYASKVGAKNVHVMAGYSNGQDAQETFCENLEYAAKMALPNGINILIEPLNQFDAPGYFLRNTDQAISIIKQIAAPNLKLMFDCYHVQRTEGDLTHRLALLMPFIGHIQFASVPDRGPPDQGEVNYGHVFSEIIALGYEMPLGAEYKPVGAVEDSLDWMTEYSGNRKE